MYQYKLIDEYLYIDHEVPFLEKYNSSSNIDIATDICIELMVNPFICYGINVITCAKDELILKNREGILMVNKLYGNGRLYADKEEDASPLIMLFLYSHLIPKQTLLFHSSLVDFSGSGIMFLGPSGIGNPGGALEQISWCGYSERRYGFYPEERGWILWLWFAMAWIIAILQECQGKTEGAGCSGAGGGKHIKAAGRV